PWHTPTVQRSYFRTRCENPLLSVSSKTAALPILRMSLASCQRYRPTKYENLDHRLRPGPRLDISLENKNCL
ncbi:hypothetical protein BS47DRAFT_1345427, partial [Hydnum rufescens UP504]